MVTNMTTDDYTNDDGEVRERMRKRFQELDEIQRKREEAGAAWVLTLTGLLMILFFTGVIPFDLPILVSIALIVIGTFFIAIAAFLRNSPNIVMREM